MTTEIKTSVDEEKPPIRRLILEGDFYLGSVLASTLVKLVLRLQRNATQEKYLNALKAEAILIMVSILRVGESSYVEKKIDEDSADRIFSCVKYLTDETDSQLIQTSFLDDTKDAFKSQIETAELKRLKLKLRISMRMLNKLMIQLFLDNLIKIVRHAVLTWMIFLWLLVVI